MEYIPNSTEIAALKAARDLAWKLLRDTVEMIKPGMNEKAARTLVQKYFKENGIEKNWHAPKIRFGTETTKNFSGTPDQEIRLQENDIYFLDYGPVLNNFEADVGDTFVTGSNPEFLHLQTSVREIFREVEAYWKKTGATGPELMEFGHECAKKRNVIFEPEKAGGHIVAEFPHQLKHRGPMRNYKSKTVEGVWILEIQLSLPGTPYGAFYEDLLVN